MLIDARTKDDYGDKVTVCCATVAIGTRVFRANTVNKNA
jgi:hypothetical protein